MKAFIIAALFVAAVLVAPPMTAAAPETVAMVAPESAALPRVWADAQTVVNAARGDANRGGLRAVASHVADLERILAAVDKNFAAARRPDNGIVALADGQAEATAVPLSMAASDGPARGAKVTVLPNPYPYAAFLLGSYYNEVGKPADALRVLELGLSLPTALPGQSLGESLPHLTSERAIALISLKRLKEALAGYDDGLRLPNLDGKIRGRMQRGRGIVLIEMERLDEAEAAYRESLVSDPDNAIALRELDYIGRLRNGQTRRPVEIQLPNAQRK